MTAQAEGEITMLHGEYRDHWIHVWQVGRFSWTGSYVPPEGLPSDFRFDPFRSLSARRTLRKLTRHIDEQIASEDRQAAHCRDLGLHPPPSIHRSEARS